MRWSLPVACLLAMALLAGCGAKADTSPAAEVVIRSDESTISGSPTGELLEGHIQGVVVDPAIRPIAGAKVSIPGISRTTTTDGGGAFYLTELQPSSYMVVAEAKGYHSAHALIEVPSGKLVKVKFILDPAPPPTPYHVTSEFKGFADVSYTDGGGNYLLVGEQLDCHACAWDVSFDPTARAYLLEAFMEPNPQGSNGFETYAYLPSNFTYAFHETGTNPLRLELAPAKLTAPTYNLSVVPHSFPGPETNKDFQVFLTAWYNSSPPADWSATKS